MRKRALKKMFNTNRCPKCKQNITGRTDKVKVNDSFGFDQVNTICKCGFLLSWTNKLGKGNWYEALTGYKMYKTRIRKVLKRRYSVLNCLNGEM